MRPDVFDPALVAVVANPHALAKLGELVQHFFVVGNRGAPRNALQHVLIGGADDYPGVRAALSGCKTGNYLRMTGCYLRMTAETSTPNRNKNRGFATLVDLMRFPLITNVRSPGPC